MKVDVSNPRVEILFEALKLGMPILRHAQIYGLDEGAAEIKPDDSALTWADRLIEETLRAYLANFGEVYGEEFGFFGDSDEEDLFVLDPVDGTRTIVNNDMGNASIIVYVYNKRTRKLVASVNGRPGTGEVWLAYDGKTVKYQWDGASEFSYVKDCKVWTPKPNAKKPTILVDCLTNFGRRGVPMLGNNALDTLTSELRRAGYSQFALGSNGTHHSVLASGGEVAGTLTLAIGGIQDLGGILLVQNAGGLVRAFRVGDDRQLYDRDPHSDLLEPGGYDIVVMAVNEYHMEILIGMLRRAFLILEDVPA